MGRLLVFTLALVGCDPGGESAPRGVEGRYQIVARETRATCDAQAPWTPGMVDEPFFRLAPVTVVGTPLLGYFPCASADPGSCAEGPRLGLSYSERGGRWWSLTGNLRSGEAGCAMVMLAGPLEATADGLVLLLSHHEGVLDVPADACTVDVLEARFAELPCQDQIRWTARRLD
ncbi:MAG: hypothetical protein R3F60_13150 [bacterium]